MLHLQNQSESKVFYPEEKHFRNSIVINNMPRNINSDALLRNVDEISMWKPDDKRVISNFQTEGRKAAFLTYSSAEIAKVCFMRIQSAFASSIFCIYDGTYLFHYCKELDKTCNSRSRNVLLSGIDCNSTKEMYVDLFMSYGDINYYEFCPVGEIPKFRVEFTRVTSAFAAVLNLQRIIGEDAVINLEAPLFPVDPIDSANFPPDLNTAPIIPAMPTLSYFTDIAKVKNKFEDLEWVQNQQLPDMTLHCRGNVEMFHTFQEEEMVKATSMEFSRKFSSERQTGVQVSRYLYECFEKITAQNMKQLMKRSITSAMTFQNAPSDTVFV